MVSPKAASSFRRGYPGCDVSADEKGRRGTVNKGPEMASGRGEGEWGKELKGKDGSEQGAEQRCSKV